MQRKSAHYRNSVFIAYHGTYDKGGTALEAERIRAKINNYPVPEAYSGPNTDERTFDKHATQVIPNSALFLFVVNDFCPQDARGCLDKKKSRYLYGEIAAFFELYKTNARNKKDFAVYYCGNTRVKRSDQAAYVKRLLGDIDPDGELGTGNQYYIIDNIELDKWINNRLVDPKISVLTDEPYYPFSILREKVTDVLNRKPKDTFVLQTERGMGKTTFVRALENDAEFATTATVKALYVSRDKNYASPENFLWDFSDLLRRDENGNMRSVDIMPVDIINSDPVRSFSRFLTEFKTKYYADKKLLVVIDGIDDMGTGGKMTVTDFFEKAEFCDGVYVMFTCRLFDSCDGRRNSAYGFVKRFDGERIIFDSQNYDYLKFLYDYFNDNIISQFPHGDNGVNVREIFTSITPKNILSFSILMKISSIYLDRTEPKNVDWRVLSSLENALDFYYNYMKTELNHETFLRYKKLLAVFALSDYVLTASDLKEAFDIDFSESLLASNGFLRIFIRLHDETSPVSFGIIHDRIKQLILSDDAPFTQNLIDEIHVKLSALVNSDIPVDELCGKRFALFKFAGALLSSERLSDDDKQKLAENMLSLPFKQDWTKPTSIAENERALLKSLSDHVESTDICEQHPVQAGIMYSVYAHDCFLLNYFYEAGGHFEACKNYFDKTDVRALSYPVQRHYAEMLTMYATHLQLCHKFDRSLELMKECTALCDELYAVNEIPLRDYTHFYVAKSNIYNSCGDLVNQKKTLDKAMKIGGDCLRVTDPARFAFMNIAYATYYKCKRKPKKAFDHILTAMRHYKIHYERDWHSMFIGDMVACTVNYISMLSRIYKDPEQCIALAQTELTEINKVIKATDFGNPNIDMGMPEALAQMYFDLGMKVECIVECDKLIDQAERLLSGKNRAFESVQAFKRRATEIREKAQKL